MKKRLKKIISLLGVICILATGNSSVYAYDDAGVTAAKALYDLGLLKGTGDSFNIDSMMLDDYATRAQIAVTVTRMLGKDKKAEYQNNAHPFYDVPDWASAHIGWLYENYLVNGVSNVEFGSNNVATLKQFCTMMLRVLGYDDSEGDFYYDSAVDVALNINLIDQEISMSENLTRENMVKICYNALKTPIKNSRRTLGKKLLDEKVFSKYIAAEVGIGTNNPLVDYFTHVDNTIGDISIYKNGSDYVVEFERPQEHFGIRVFYVSASVPTVTEIPLGAGNVYFEKGKITYPNNSPAGYIDRVYIKNMMNDEDLKVIVIKTTSEDVLYQTVGKSGIASY